MLGLTPLRSGLITFNEFCNRVMPPDYVMRRDAQGQRTQMQGVPAIVRNRARRVVQPTQAQNFGPFDSKMIPPSPHDTRAVNLIREKVAQRTRDANDNRPGVQLRDALGLYDTQKSGRINSDAFRRVLERYNVFLSDSEFEALESKYSPPAHPGTMEYKPFLQKVLAAKNQQSGAFGPHVQPTWQLSAPPRPATSDPATDTRTWMQAMQDFPPPNRPTTPSSRPIMSRPSTSGSARSINSARGARSPPPLLALVPPSELVLVLRRGPRQTLAGDVLHAALCAAFPERALPPRRLGEDRTRPGDPGMRGLCRR